MAFNTNEVEELVVEGYNILKDTWWEIYRLENLIGKCNVQDDFSRSGLRRYIEDMSSNISDSDCVSLKENEEQTKLKTRVRLSDNDAAEASTSGETEKNKNIMNQGKDKPPENEKPELRINEAQFLKEYYKIHALRPVHNVEPGRLPYRHDQFRRMEQYRKGWRENPAPGDRSYRAERMEIRQKMTERDVPRLKVCLNIKK